jgi:hypothetical protein
VNKDCQTRAVTGVPRAELSVPDSVSVAMADLAETLREAPSRPSAAQRFAAAELRANATGRCPASSTS